jgi:hypothetical protein
MPLKIRKNAPDRFHCARSVYHSLSVAPLEGGKSEALFPNCGRILLRLSSPSFALDHVESIGRLSSRVNPQNPSADSGPDLQLKIAYLLLIDVVGYSKLLVNEEIELLQELNHILHSFRVAEAIGDA